MSTIIFPMKQNDKIEKALEVLDKATDGDATEWYNFRMQSHYRHIVDHSTGKWVSQFEADGTTFYILSPTSGIGLKRYTELMKRLPSIGFDSTFTMMQKHLSAAIFHASKIGSQEHDIKSLMEALINMEQGLVRNDREWQMSFILCTLFIVEKGEDLNTWSFEDAKVKIEKWNKAQIHEQDFFFLVMFWRTLHSKWFEPLPGKIQQLVKDWNPLTSGIKKMENQ